MARIGLCDSAREASRKAKGWRETLAMYTEPHGVIQSDGKLQILADMLPDTVRERAELLDRLGDPLKQRVVCSALHLGCIHALQSEARLQVEQRLQKATNAWHAFQHFWNDQSVALQWRCQVFWATVFVLQSMASKSHVSPSRC